MFRETGFQEKLQVFFEICDEDGSGDIDEEEFFNVLKLCVTDPKERKLLKSSLHELFLAIDEDGNGVITKDEIIKAASQSEALKTIIEKSIMTVSGVDSWIASDFYHSENMQLFVGNNKRRNGICHAQIEKIVNMFEYEEKIYERDKKINEENKKKIKHWKIINGHLDMSSDDEQKEIIYGADGKIILY